MPWPNNFIFFLNLFCTLFSPSPYLREVGWLPHTVDPTEGDDVRPLLLLGIHCVSQDVNPASRGQDLNTWLVECALHSGSDIWNSWIRNESSIFEKRKKCVDQLSYISKMRTVFICIQGALLHYLSYIVKATTKHTKH